jgi:hypothetical protein
MRVRALALVVALAAIACVCTVARAQQVVIDPAANLTNMTMSMGIASYGISNISADTGPYVVDTDEVVGVARINGMLAYNASLPATQNLSAYAASLQLNAVVDIAAQDGALQYWLQDVIEFNTSNMTYYYTDNVWNVTTPTANVSNATLIGGGGVLLSSTQALNGTWQNQTFYASASNLTLPLAYPETLIPVIALARNGTYPMVRMGYIQNGSYVFYDNVTIAAPGGAASMLVTPYQKTPAIDQANASYYDAELVFGGPSNQTMADFEYINATLWLGYAGDNGIEPFPYLATFGSDTGETAQGISVRQGSGSAALGTGTPDYNATIVLAGVPAALAGVQPVGNESVAAPSMTNSTAHNAAQPTPWQWYLAVALAFVVAVAAALHVVAGRHRARKRHA